MATTKPPWSQYEGVAALFRIGNSKEHPPIPNHLSQEGKEFVWQCLQRNPQDRPTAIKLLEHPFVRNSASPERWVIISDPLEPHRTEKNAKIYRSNGHAKSISGLDLEGVSVQLSRGFKNGSVSRNRHMSKHISCPVSPVGSPRLHARASQPMCSRRSRISSSQSASGSSTPRTNSDVSFPVNHLDHVMPYPHDVMGAQRPQKCLIDRDDTFYCKRKLETLSGVPEASQVNGTVAPCQSDAVRSKPLQLYHKKPEGFCNRQSVLANRVSQQLLMDHLS